MNGKYLYLAISSLLGILSPLTSLFPFLLLEVIYFFLLVKFKRFSNLQLALVVGVFLLFLLIGFQASVKNKTIIPNSTTRFYLEYNQDAKIDGDLFQVIGTDTRYDEKLLIRYQIKSEIEKEALQKKSIYGIQCIVTGELLQPAVAKNLNGFDYRKYLATKSIYWEVNTQDSPLQKCIPVRSTILTMIKQLRFNGIKYLESHFPSEIASLSAALIFGDRSLLNPDLLADYQKTGIVHLLAISGLHVSLLVAMFFYLGIRCGLTREAMDKLLLLTLPVYTILTGAAPSVIRSTLMIFLVLITSMRKSPLKLLPLDAVSLALMVFLFIVPKGIFDIGFQLSFSVSIGIILSAPFILKIYQSNILRMLTTSMIAQLAAFPLLLYHYFEISFISIAANLVYIPLFSFVYLPGLYLLFIVQLLFGRVPPIVVNLFGQLITFSNRLIGNLSSYSMLHFVPGRPNWLMIIVYISVIITIFFVWETVLSGKKKRPLIVLFCFLLLIQPSWNWLNPTGEVTMIDVGQGDSIFIHLPNGQGNYLIDTGGTLGFPGENWRKRAKPYEVGRDVVVPYLKGIGVTKLDKLILTHGDMDHIGGAFSIMKEIKIKQIIMPSVSEPSETEMNIIKEANRRGILVTKVSSGMQWKSKDSFFYVLSPEKNYTGERNGGSVTIYAKIGGLKWFFGGDLDQEGELKVIKKYPQLMIDVLKAGHHGSRTSSAEAFINQIKPKVALISAGENNRFGHPHQEVLDLFRKMNIMIYRTDLEGAITYRFFRGTGTFTTYLP